MVDVEFGQVVLGAIVNHAGHDGGKESSASKEKDKWIVSPCCEDAEIVEESDFQVRVVASEFIEPFKPDGKREPRESMQREENIEIFSAFGS